MYGLGKQDKTIAHVVPLLVFMLFLMLPQILEVVGFFIDNKYMPWYRRAPEQWIYPLQTFVGLGLLAKYWKHYDFKPVSGKGMLMATVMALIGIVVWIAPGHLFRTQGIGEGLPTFLGFQERVEGFDPSFIKEHSMCWYVSALVMRFIRMVIVVALVEEIFWRGFLMRFLLNPDGNYWKQPFGKFSWMSFAVVTLAFMFAHAPVDWGACIVYGALTYWVAVRTKSLFACVWMHGVANLSLGIYTLCTEQWGYW
jgi:CAAX prenyl protease-like protein